MTKVDKYLNKYIEGSITELEMHEFRELLEAEPQLQSELRQILDLRSLVHDDLLTLNPPEALSYNVRELVGAQFGALAKEEEEDRRRKIFFTERISGSFVTAMVALVLVALAPNLIAPSGSDRGGSLFDIASVERNSTLTTDANVDRIAPVTTSAVSAGSLNRGDRGVESISGNRTGRTSDESIDRSDVALAAETDNTVVTSSENAIDRPIENEIAVASTDDEIGMASEIVLPPRPDLLFAYGSGVETDRAVSLAINRGAELIGGDEKQSRNHNPAYITAELPILSKELESDDPSNPRIAFGFTVGAGALTSSSSSVALTQGAGYAAFSLSESNRIGIEAGGSKFRYVHTTYTQEITALSRRTASADDELGSHSGSGVAGVYQIYGSGGGGKGGGSAVVPVSNPGGQGDPTERFDNKPGNDPIFFGEGGRTNLQSPKHVNVTIRSHTYESDTSMGYGMLFYDRRVVEVNDELNIRSRVGVGGTDGGIILDLRAYAAFATNQNVAITLGVGGSALRELSKDGTLSANYGVQLGAELGF